MSSKILITGANGFLGKAVTYRLSKDRSREIIPLKGRERWDLTNQKHVDYVLKEFEPDSVVHLAAVCGGIGINREQPGKFMHDNLAMGMNLIESCRKYGNIKKFVMVGTVCAYPKYTTVPFKEEDLWNGYPEETNAPYGIAKKTLTELLIAYYKQYGFQSTNLIPVNMYGPNDNFNPQSSHVIPALILKIDKAIEENADSITLWGTGKASREFLYVDDCAKAIESSLGVETLPYPINIGTGEETTIQNLASTLCQIMGFEGNIIYDSDFPDGQPRRCLDVSKAYRLFGFTARTKLYNGLKNTVSWYYKNKYREGIDEHLSNIR